tara:strand:- start:11666 stop:12142 length:477 start_codon:yes stop_codon:yes gene_type:complete
MFLLNYEFLILGWVLLAICSLLVLIHTVKKYKALLLIFIPMVLFLTGATYFSVNGLLGFPTIQSLPEKFLIKSHIIDEENNIIYLWVIDIKNPDHKPRAHTIDFSMKLMKQLEETKRKRDKGIPIIGERKINQTSEDPNENTIRIYVFPHQEMMKKDG